MDVLKHVTIRGLGEVKVAKIQLSIIERPLCDQCTSRKAIIDTRNKSGIWMYMCRRCGVTHADRSFMIALNEEADNED